MNQRLNCIASRVPFGKGLIDVGTDHGFLPVELARRGYPGSLIASDINAGPLETARRSAAEAGLTDRIRFCLCDGLDGCDPESVDTIVIAGMGGDTICGILDRAEWCLDARYFLLLQPMSHAEVLRYWLIHNGFVIAEEDLVTDNGWLYTVLTARFGGEMKLSDAELFTGAGALLHGHPLYPRLLRQQKARFEKALLSLEKADNLALKGRCELLRGIVRELGEMEAYEDN